MLICTFDDRETDILGLKLLVCSLARHHPGVPVYLACPVADRDFKEWLRAYPWVTFDGNPDLKGKGWDVKPLLLRKLLESGHETVMWMDSDIIVTNHFLELMPNDRSLVVTEEMVLNRFAVEQRVTGWGLEVGRSLPGVNSCVVRANSSHLPLIRRWQEMLQHADYRHARTLPFEQRLPHVVSDQDVLLGLLASQDFLDVKVHVLRAGREIIQSNGPRGYSPLQRLTHLWRGVPPLVHSQGPKPWRFPSRPPLKQLSEFFLHLHLETAPYAHFAKMHRLAIQPFPACLEVRSPLGRLSRRLSLGKPALGGFVQACTISLWLQFGKAAYLPYKVLRKLRTTVAGGLAKLTRKL